MKKNRIDKDKAIQSAVNYCNSRKLSAAKLLKEHRSWSEDSYYFSHSNGVESDGLTNDLASQDYCTLVVKADGSVEETEYTRRYLSE